jgi:histidyl-tRNA synthetase
VPFARFAAQHIGQLGTPFKRYHLGPVWRGENPQQGRFREFWQCDFDTIGTTSNAADIEVALVIYDLMRALGIERFEVCVNNRLVLNGLLEEMGLAGKTAPVLVALDKLAKAGKEAVTTEMAEKAGVSAEQAGRLLALAEMRGDNAEILKVLRTDFGGNEKAAAGIGRLQQLLDVCRAAGIPDGTLRLDLSIARGLAYYTGTVYETFLLDKRDFGSVCSGGRYDNLAELYTKQKLPGVGASLGLDRLLAAMEALNLLPKVATPAPVFVVQFDAERLGDYQRLARSLRAAGIGVEVYPEAKKVGQQLSYAETRGFRVALIAGADEFAKGVWLMKDLAAARVEGNRGVEVPDAGVAEAVRAVLAKGT